jgi:hypothetical protein
VYAAKDIPVNDDDMLAFELFDRLKNKRFKIIIPPLIHNKQKKV